MEKINTSLVKKLYKPSKESHKGQNGKLTIVGGSKLFHGASLWALKIASRIVDMVFYATVEENRRLTEKLNSELYDFICIPRDKEEEYIEQSDAVLIGPGLVRGDKSYTGTGESCRQTKELTKKLLFKFPHKKWIIDAGSLQEMEANWLKKLKNVIITPHLMEFNSLFKLRIKSEELRIKFKNLELEKQIVNSSQQPVARSQQPETNHLSSVINHLAKEYGCTIVLKGPTDIVCDEKKCVYNTTGNEGMTKGGTGDVLAGLIAGLACKNDLFSAASFGVYINGLAGDELYKKVGPYFNASDLCDEIPKTMAKLLGYK